MGQWQPTMEDMGLNVKNVTRQSSLPGLAILFAAAALYLLNTFRHALVRWDDAYIAFRFARHVADGTGLVWNVGGERVEGYTSLLQVLLLALGVKSGIEPFDSSIMLSVLCVLLTVGMLTLLAYKFFGYLSLFAAVLIGVYLVDDATAIHSASGLETQLFVLFLCAASCIALLFLDAPQVWIAVCLALAVFLSVLTRPEGVLYGGAVYLVLAGYVLYRYRRDGETRALILLAGSAGLLLGLGMVYALSKYSYFGYLLPNPFYVKSNQVSFEGVRYVGAFVLHLMLWFGAPALVFLLLLKAKAFHAVKDVRSVATLALTLVPAFVGLGYYATIIHETGGAHRFSYPTYFYFVIALVWLASRTLAPQGFTRKSLPALALVAVLYLAAPVAVQGSWQPQQLPVDGFTQYHLKIANALEQSGLGSRGLVYTDAAGLIPYTSNFNQLDRVGLVDNFLSGRHPVSLQEREAYLWGQNADVYVGYEPPAAAGAQTRAGDARMSSAYVTSDLMGRELRGIEDRIFVRDPDLLYSRMQELRDDWIWLGEMEWPGWKLWRLRSFIYVRRDSPHAAVLTNALAPIIAIKPERIDLSQAPQYDTLLRAGMSNPP